MAAEPKACTEPCASITRGACPKVAQVSAGSCRIQIDVSAVSIRFNKGQGSTTVPSTSTGWAVSNTCKLGASRWLCSTNSRVSQSDPVPPWSWLPGIINTFRPIWPILPRAVARVLALGLFESNTSPATTTKRAPSCRAISPSLSITSKRASRRRICCSLSVTHP